MLRKWLLCYTTTTPQTCGERHCALIFKWIVTDIQQREPHMPPQHGKATQCIRAQPVVRHCHMSVYAGVRQIIYSFEMLVAAAGVIGLMSVLSTACMSKDPLLVGTFPVPMLLPSS